ncbi:Hsp20/alpha crystallin family protein [Dyadobacter psychrotolerans]|uniref:Hsp20/alpha crystallin family protein n=1 Tax=Dyadobacter psychrotolerans TaxID=2541721 RepID=A0A4R5E2F7_9BACT|nr:Hsp20/alpha crystallin family protein [Dyadobacter psychrotolerans]TDE18283.1 Hsp20/alpha crystallin family protein [Dyadobacter psychrotolerans]
MNNQQTAGNTQNQQGFSRRGRGCGPFGKMFAGQFGGKENWGKFPGQFGNRKAANIEESDSAFVISLYAAGLVKSNFKISVSEDVLSIAYNLPENSNTDSARYTHREYQPGSFERSFQLNGKVLTDSISASYTDGVLSVTLPKNPETNKPAQEIGVN